MCLSHFFHRFQAKSKFSRLKLQDFSPFFLSLPSGRIDCHQIFSPSFVFSMWDVFLDGFFFPSPEVRYFYASHPMFLDPKKTAISHRKSGGGNDLGDCWRWYWNQGPAWWRVKQTWHRGEMYAKLVGMLPWKLMAGTWKWHLSTKKTHLFNLHFGVQNVSLWVEYHLCYTPKNWLGYQKWWCGTCISFETWLFSVLLVC